MANCSSPIIITQKPALRRPVIHPLHGPGDTVLGGALSPGTREGHPVLAGLVREMLLSNHPAGYAAHCPAAHHSRHRPPDHAGTA